MPDDPKLSKPAAPTPAGGEDSATQSSSEDAPAEHDVVLVHSRTEDGQGVKALRSRPGRLEAAEIRPIKEGQPLHSGELIAVKERAGSPLLWDVEVLHDIEAESGHAGPPKIASSRYRKNWDAIFGAAGKKRAKRRPGGTDKGNLN